MTIVVYAAILPVLWLVPKELTATADGEEVAAEQAPEQTALSLAAGKS